MENIENTVWDFGNDILYKLCQENFHHNNESIIATKTLFIGRIYAAAIERRKPEKLNQIGNDDFYIEKIIPQFKNSNLDEKLEEIKNYEISDDKILKILSVHKYLVEKLKEITNLEKRSFSSKYLHFHLPNLFFIYDTRAVESIRKEKIKIPKKYLLILKDCEDIVDKEYANFYLKCILLKDKLSEKLGKNITIRNVDNYLLNHK